ncbi:MAG: hypothetical protein LBD11_04995 [Candidatus Peribacteria bacterium]|jgi:hypothetical protein|nr:hypothetical protein [Candidatus Peribacteria bacterium]
MVAISTTTKIGFYYGIDMYREPGIEVELPFKPNIETMGNINWHDYIVADTPQYHSY